MCVGERIYLARGWHMGFVLIQRAFDCKHQTNSMRDGLILSSHFKKFENFR